MCIQTILEVVIEFHLDLHILFTIFILGKLPKFFELINPRSGSCSKFERFELLSWIVMGTEIFVSELQIIPKEFLFSSLVLLYLLRVSAIFFSFF